MRPSSIRTSAAVTTDPVASTAPPAPPSPAAPMDQPTRDWGQAEPTAPTGDGQEIAEQGAEIPVQRADPGHEPTAGLGFPDDGDTDPSGFTQPK